MSENEYATTTHSTTQATDTARKPRGGRFRKKACRFCQNTDLEINYKRADILIQLVSNKGKILPRRLTGTCAKHQRQVARAIKKSRMAGFMPFSVK